MDGTPTANGRSEQRSSPQKVAVFFWEAPERDLEISVKASVMLDKIGQPTQTLEDGRLVSASLICFLTRDKTFPFVSAESASQFLYEQTADAFS
jgi:hypothetical protein